MVFFEFVKTKKILPIISAPNGLSDMDGESTKYYLSLKALYLYEIYARVFNIDTSLIIVYYLKYNHGYYNRDWYKH